MDSIKEIYQLSIIGDKYMWIGTFKSPLDHHIESDDRYFYTEDVSLRDSLNMRKK